MTESNSLTGILVQVGGLIVIGALMMLLMRLLRFRARSYAIASPRASALWALCAIGASLMLVMGLLLINSGDANVEGRDTNSNPRGSAGDVLGQILVSLITVAPVLIIMKSRREAPESSGVSISNLGRSVVLSAFLVAAMVGWCLLVWRGLDMATLLRTSGMRALLQYTIVGFTEEFAYRGYLQSRLMAWLGGYSGWALASVIMAMGHAIHRTVALRMSAGDALISSASLIPISMFLGFVMMQTRNIVVPGLLHTGINWLDL